MVIYTQEQVEEKFKNNGWKLEDTYVHSRTSLKCSCLAEGHEVYMTLDNLNRNRPKARKSSSRRGGGLLINTRLYMLKELIKQLTLIRGQNESK